MTHRHTIALLVRTDGTAPLQQQIYTGIRRAILDGVLTPGSRLPSSRGLAADLGVSRTTTVLAYDQLIAEGYLQARHGSGTYVAAVLPDDLPQPRLVRSPSPAFHPPLSRRGVALAAVPRPAHRVAVPPRPFRLGSPALDLFPVRLWSSLAARRWRSVTATQLDYGDAAGFRPLREAIADHVRTARAAPCEPDQVFIVGGSQRGLELMARLLLDAGDEAWVEEPGYTGARSALVSAGASIVPVPVDADGLDVDAGVRAAPRARLAMVTPSHQFPLGTYMSLPRRVALLEWARRARAWVLEDDYDSEFRYGTRPIPSLHGLDSDGRVVYVGSFSKTVFPSLRLGFVIVPPDLRDLLISARVAADVHPPLPDQMVLADFIAEGHFERHLRRMRAAYRERLDALGEGIRQYCRGVLRMRPVRTGMHAVVDVNGVDARRVALEAASRGIEVMPLASYYVAPAQATNALVLGFAATRPDVLRPGVERLAAAIEAARSSRISAATRG